MTLARKRKYVVHIFHRKRRRNIDLYLLMWNAFPLAYNSGKNGTKFLKDLFLETSIDPVQC